MRVAARVTAYVLGVAFVLAGVFGFVETGFSGWLAADTDAYLTWLRLNPMHNLAHVVLGAVLLVGASGSERAARAWAGVVGLLYVGVAAYGFVLVGEPSWNVLALNTVDNWFHLVTGLALLLAAFTSFSTARPTVRRRGG